MADRPHQPHDGDQAPTEAPVRPGLEEQSMVQAQSPSQAPAQIVGNIYNLAVDADGPPVDLRNNANFRIWQASIESLFDDGEKVVF